MRFSWICTIAAAGAALTGCATTTASNDQAQRSDENATAVTTIDNVTPPTDYGLKCNAKPAQNAIGLNATESVVEVVRAKASAYVVRIVRPGQMMTKEYSTRRVNLEVDVAGRIISVTCG